MSDCGAKTSYESNLTGQPYVCDRPRGHPGAHQEHADLRARRVMWHSWEDES